MMALSYTVNWIDATVTVFTAAVGADGVVLDEDDLITMLSDLQSGDTTLAEQAGL